MKIITFDLVSTRTSDRKAAEVLVLAGSVVVLFSWTRNFASPDLSPHDKEK